MSNNILINYLSRSQIKAFLAYILDNGADSIIESPDSTYADEAMAKVIGAAINSIKQYHVERHLNHEVHLTALSYALVSENKLPQKPEGTVITGVVYMSKKGKEYEGAADNFGNTAHVGDSGDALWITNEEWESLSLGETTEGTNYRLFVFWGIAAER